MSSEHLTNGQVDSSHFLQTNIEHLICNTFKIAVFLNILYLSESHTFCILVQMVHLNVILRVPFFITFEMAMWTFDTPTLVRRSNMSVQNPLQTCFIIAIVALQILHNNLMLSGFVKVQRSFV